MSRSKHSPEERIRIAELCISGKLGQSEAARQAGVDHRTVADWIRLYSTEGATGFLPREHNNQYSPELKEAAVKAYLAGEGSLQEICKRYKIREIENERIAEIIEGIHTESPDKGYRRIKDDLDHDYNIAVNEKRVLRICREKDIKSTIKYKNNGYKITCNSKNPQF